MRKIPSFLKKKKFWLCFFLPIFGILTTFSFIYSFVVIKDTAISSSFITIGETPNKQVLESLAELSIIDSTLSLTENKLKDKGIKFSDGTSIDKNYIKDGFSSYYSITNPLIQFNYIKPVNETYLIKSILDTHTDSILETFLKNYPSYSEIAKVSSYSNEPTKVNNNRYQFLIGFPLLGIVLSIGAYLFLYPNKNKEESEDCVNI